MSIPHPCPGHGDDGLYGNESCRKMITMYREAGERLNTMLEKKDRGQV